MKSLSIMLATVCLAVASPVLVTPASAYVASTTVTSHYGGYGHGCRTVRSNVRRGYSDRVSVHRRCR